MATSRNKKILISGASIAGPVLAYWLHRYGFQVTVVEKAGAVRSGGYPIDIRGTAIDVVKRMGVLSRIAAAHIDSRRITFVDGDGALIGSIRPEALTGGKEGRDLELPRGELTTVLYDAVRDDVEFRFGDSITALNEHGGGVDVRFQSGLQRPFDLVIGADGLHSNTRRLAFGPEAQYHRYLGYCFAGFTIPNTLGFSHEAFISNTPGKAAVLFAAGDSDRLHAFLTFARPQPPFSEFADIEAQRRLTASVFAGARWEVPRMLAALQEATDVFFDVVSQIRMPRWSKGRVALVGDAAHAPSFLSGQGTSTAMVGAYVLAGELATHSDPGAAFASYERVMRPFVEVNQALAGGGAASLIPATSRALWIRNQALRVAPWLTRTGLPGRKGRKASTALTLPLYGVQARG
ncbi:FAD-dependent monooxygenase [Sorangium sp. So ce327]|uniref:FAD-dependent monooxygenase n=1 Tax=Sorangium sp. So ce327 TaxID=3133301 RepID=UPI003F5E5CBC